MGVQFRGDQRAVSEVVGAILLFGMLILALTSYQAAVVPTQNAQTEYQHSLQVEDEMVDLRNAVLAARSSGTATFASVTLGTQYRERILTINPPPATGRLQTVRQENITVTETGGEQRPDPLGLDERPLENQFIEYTPHYAEYQSAGTIRYENTVTYHQYPAANRMLTNQRLLQNDQVILAPIEGTIAESGTRRVTVDPIPGILQTIDVVDPELTLPTELSEADWNQILDAELSSDESVTVSNNTLTLQLRGTYELVYSPVGADRAPQEGTRSSSAGEINPASPGNVQLVGVQWDGDTVTLSFRNSADNSSFTEGRINFFSGNSNPTEVLAVNAPDAGSNPRSENWVIGADFRDLDPNIFLEGDRSTTDIKYVFDQNLNQNQDFFVTTLTLETGERATYFIGGEFSTDGGGGSGSANLQVTNVGGGGNSEVPFSIENTGSADAVIAGLSVDSTTNNQAKSVENATGNEFERTDGSGSREGVITIGGGRVNLDTTVTIGAGTEADFYLGEFRRGNGNTANMNTHNVTITVSLSDGTEQQLVLEN